MRSAECPACSAQFDPLLAPMRVIDGRVVAVCGACPEQAVATQAERRAGINPAPTYAQAPTAQTNVAAPTVQTAAPTAQTNVAAPTVDTNVGAGFIPARMDAAQPSTTPAAVPVPIEPTLTARTRLRARRRKITLAVVASVAMMALAGAWAWKTGPAVGLAAAASADRQFVEGQKSAANIFNQQITARPPESLRDLQKTTIAKRGNEPFGSDWVYPLPGSKKWRTTALGSFGARRPGNRPSECRKGHCGVDLHGPRGMPVVTILPGKVSYIGRTPWRRSGKFVRITHDDGLVSSYMHLDSIGKTLALHQRVEAGAQVGTLGRTGIKKSPAHLHFSVSRDKKLGRHYFNPAGPLSRARMIEKPR